MKNTSSLRLIFEAGVRAIKKHLPTILTVAGAIGVVATAITSADAGAKAERLKEQDAPQTDILKTAVTPTVVAVSTIACVAGSNALNKKKIANLMATYAALYASYKEYKANCIRLYGEGENKEIMETIAEKTSKESNVTAQDASEHGKRLYYEPWADRFFESTDAEIMQAAYRMNRQLAVCGEVFVSDFYRFLGLECMDEDKTNGWTATYLDLPWTSPTSWLDIELEPATFEDGETYTMVSFGEDPWPLI